VSPESPLKQILEAALLAAGGPLNLERFLDLFLDHERPEPRRIREALSALAADYRGRGMELVEVASGWRIQVRQDYAPWVSRLFAERPTRYSRALLETLAIVAYRQPVTRGEIEEIRGVTVSSNLVKTLMEREWIREVGHRDVPGRPALLATTRQFLDYFGLKSLDELPTLQALKDLDQLDAELPLEDPQQAMVPAAALTERGGAEP
jgi:segregation and condensation protein B